MNTSTLRTASTGMTRTMTLRMGIELSCDWPKGAGRVPSLKGCRGMDLATAAMTMAAIPRTESSPRVSSARNSTRMVATTFCPLVISGASVRYHMASSERSRRPSRAWTPVKATAPANKAMIRAPICRLPDFTFGNRLGW